MTNAIISAVSIFTMVITGISWALTHAYSHPQL
jgi:hypothetical protein